MKKILIIGCLIIFCLFFGVNNSFAMMSSSGASATQNELTENQVLEGVLDRLFKFSDKTTISCNHDKKIIIFEMDLYKLTLIKENDDNFNVLLQYDENCLTKKNCVPGWVPILHITVNGKSPIYKKCHNLFEKSITIAKQREVEKKLEKEQENLKTSDQAFR